MKTISKNHKLAISLITSCCQAEPSFTFRVASVLHGIDSTRSWKLLLYFYITVSIPKAKGFKRSKLPVCKHIIKKKGVYFTPLYNLLLFLRQSKWNLPKGHMNHSCSLFTQLRFLSDVMATLLKKMLVT